MPVKVFKDFIKEIFISIIVLLVDTKNEGFLCQR